MKGFIGVALIGVRLLVLLVSFHRGSLTVISPKIPQEIKSAKAQIEGEAELNSSGTTDEGRVRDVIMAWCAAYSQMNSKAMVSIETTNAEIVDGFGELHRSLSRSSRESFWDEGFEMIQPEQFHPECVLEHIQFLDPEAAVVQVRTAYLLGIELKGGEVIPPYAEVHTFIATRSEGQWLIAAHIFVREQMTRTSGAVSWEALNSRASKRRVILGVVPPCRLVRGHYDCWLGCSAFFRVRTQPQDHSQLLAEVHRESESRF